MSFFTNIGLLPFIKSRNYYLFVLFTINLTNGQILNRYLFFANYRKYKNSIFFNGLQGTKIIQNTFI